MMKNQRKWLVLEIKNPRAKKSKRIGKCINDMTLNDVKSLGYKEMKEVKNCIGFMIFSETVQGNKTLQFSSFY